MAQQKAAKAKEVVAKQRAADAQVKLTIAAAGAVLNVKAAQAKTTVTAKKEAQLAKIDALQKRVRGATQMKKKAEQTRAAMEDRRAAAASQEAARIAAACQKAERFKADRMLRICFEQWQANVDMQIARLQVAAHKAATHHRRWVLGAAFGAFIAQREQKILSFAKQYQATLHFTKLAVVKTWASWVVLSQLARTVRVVTFSFLCPLLEKYGTFIARCNALIEKVSSFRVSTGIVMTQKRA
eukprot:SAG31_NODE_9357_length_1290_cov_1.521411_1_plen_241_part_01